MQNMQIQNSGNHMAVPGRYRAFRRSPRQLPQNKRRAVRQDMESWRLILSALQTIHKTLHLYLLKAQKKQENKDLRKEVDA